MQVQIGAGLVVDVDTTTLPANATEHALYIGLRNILMDAHASVTKDDYPKTDEWQAAKRAMADKKLAALMAGDVRVGGIATRGPVDPIEAIVHRLAKEAVRNWLVNYAKEKGKKVNTFLATLSKEYVAKLVADHIERNRDRLTAAAEAEIAMRAEQVADIDLEALEAALSGEDEDETAQHVDGDIS